WTWYSYVRLRPADEILGPRNQQDLRVSAQAHGLLPGTQEEYANNGRAFRGCHPPRRSESGKAVRYRRVGAVEGLATMSRTTDLATRNVAGRFTSRMAGFLLFSIMTIVTIQYWWKLPLEKLRSPADILGLMLGLVLGFACLLLGFRAEPRS